MPVLKLKDILFARHRENNDREFFVTLKIKEEDISLEQKEMIRELVRNKVAIDGTFDLGEATAPIDQSTGEIFQSKADSININL